MNLRVSGFDWDHGNRTKCQEHGVTIAQIEALFQHSPRIAPDLKHMTDEDRLIAVGKNRRMAAFVCRLHNFVASTIRTKDGRRLIRPVSARYMHAKEIEAYEEESSPSEKRSGR
ncbi:MAG: BrnT family toxin [Bryobacteraceae bacterium]